MRIYFYVRALFTFCQTDFFKSTAMVKQLLLFESFAKKVQLSFLHMQLKKEELNI